MDSMMPSVSLPDMLTLIRKKKAGIPLNDTEIRYFVKGVTDGSLPDYQISAFLMAECFRPFDARETAALTFAMAESGDTADLSSLPGIKADKHSTGGVGDKTSLILAPMVAAANAGVVVAKMSGRGLGHTGGTIDKLESIPGIDLAPAPEKFADVIRKTGLCIAGQSGQLAPADKRLYALRDVTDTVDSLPLIASSILSKKLASGSDVIVLDVKCGDGAFMKTQADAEALARAMLAIGRTAGKKIAAVLTDMDEPLGYTVGNALELKEAIAVLNGNERGRLRTLCIRLAGMMVALATDKDLAECEQTVSDTLDNGTALQKLKDMVEALGGNPDCITNPNTLPSAKYSCIFPADRDGYLQRVAAETVGRASLALGAGRHKKNDPISYGAGIVFTHIQGDAVRAGMPIATLYSDRYDFSEALKLLSSAVTIGDTAPAPRPLILETLGM